MVMEEQIIKVAKSAIKEAVVKSLTGYNSPFDRYAKTAIENH